MNNFVKSFKITTVFAPSDLMAVGVINAIKEMKKSVLDDISVVGFGNIPLISYLNPSLTTVRQPTFKKGR